MSSVEQLFATVLETSNTFVINEDRSITVPEVAKHIGVQYDHNVEVIEFKCPRYWDGVDLSTMAVYINYVRSDGYEGTYECIDSHIDSDDDTKIRFSWTVSKNVTATAGVINFVVCLQQFDEDVELPTRKWHSKVCDSCYISTGIPCGGEPDETLSDVTTSVLGSAILGTMVLGA